MMPVIRRNYPDIAPGGPTYSRIARTGSWTFISGCTARDSEAQGKPVMEQLRVIIDRITRIVAAEGGNPSGIVKTTTFVTSIADWRANAKEQQALFEEFYKGEYPANSLVEVMALAQPGLDVEIEATVVLD
jgi:enamine deaminase RidA (YjgF/YER057c/UK114 family)